MKKAAFVIGAILLLLVLAAAAYMLYARFSASSLPVSGPVTFPMASSTDALGQPRTIGSDDGTTIVTRDFINNGVTIEDPANTGHYYLAGDNDVCNEDGTCPNAGEINDFTIVYFSEDNSFIIGLKTEPLGEVRRSAEQYLMNALGLNESQMCMLKYTLGTTVYVNSIYGSKGNLGFSFCPGAVKLP